MITTWWPLLFLEERQVMQNQIERFHRLSQLVDVACDYRGWTKVQLASALDRDPGSVLPRSGNPKLDYLTRLADVLEWPVGDVAAVLNGPRLDPLLPDSDQEQPLLEELGRLDYAQAVALALESQRAGNFSAVVRYAQRAANLAGTGERLARALQYEAIGWQYLGRSTIALEVLNQALAQPNLSPRLKRILQVNTGNAYYTLWRLTEARALSAELIETMTRLNSDNKFDRSAEAFAHYVYGNTLRRQIILDHADALNLAEVGIEHFHQCIRLYESLRYDVDASQLGDGVIRTCRGAIMELEVALERQPAIEALREMESALDDIFDVEKFPRNDLLEGYGWWCIFACNIAHRYMDGPEKHRFMAQFTMKGYEVADRLENWPIRERLFTLDYLRRQAISDTDGVIEEWVLHPSEVRVLIGTMGRFPHFRSVGWSIIESASVIRDRGSARNQTPKSEIRPVQYAEKYKTA